MLRAYAVYTDQNLPDSTDYSWFVCNTETHFTQQDEEKKCCKLHIYIHNVCLNATTGMLSFFFCFSLSLRLQHCVAPCVRLRVSKWNRKQNERNIWTMLIRNVDRRIVHRWYVACFPLRSYVGNFSKPTKKKLFQHSFYWRKLCTCHRGKNASRHL